MNRGQQFGGKRAAAKWSSVKLAEVATIDRVSIASKDIQGNELYVGLENITGDGNFVDVGPAGASTLKSNKFKFTSDHVLFGKLRPYLAKIAAPGFAGICSTDILPILPGNHLDRRYLLHHLRTPPMVARATDSAVGINLPRLSPRMLESFAIPLPPIEEQRQIATVLDAAGALRSKRREEVAKLDELARSIFFDMFGDPISRAKQLNYVPLGELLKLKSGAGLPVKAMQPGPHLVYGANGVTGTHSEYMFEESKIVIGRVGSCGSVHVSEPRSWITDNALYVSQMSPRLQSTYLATALELVNLNRFASQAAQPLISGGRVYPVEIPVPSLDAQQQFEQKVLAIAAHRGRMEQASTMLNDLFASLQQRAFRGEL